MPELRPEQRRKPAQKLTPEVIRNNPLLRKLIIDRIKDLKAVRAARLRDEPQLPLKEKKP